VVIDSHAQHAIICWYFSSKYYIHSDFLLGWIRAVDAHQVSRRIMASRHVLTSRGNHRARHCDTLWSQ
jgi:hypothetical protein